VSIAAPAWSNDIQGVAELCEIAAAAAYQATHPSTQQAEVSILLTDDAQVKALNRDYRGRDEATNVLAFAFEDGQDQGAALAEEQIDSPALLGDIVIANETCVAEAALEGKSVSDHLSHLVVHGMLHLLGYDHMTERDAGRMEQLEVSILATLGVPDPY
jgi:probable rRNA maturation factor